MTPFVGEVAIVGFNFAPIGWAFCDGQLLPISEFEALFNLIGTTYGGDGITTFGLPNLQSRVPMHMGTGFPLGQTGGVESVQLSLNQIPSHNHLLLGMESSATSRSPAGAVLAAPQRDVYSDVGSTALNAAAISSAGGSQPHSNIQPYLAVSFIISLFGIFPSQG